LIRKMPYTPGDRRARQPVVVADLSSRYQSTVHWPKTLDVSSDGTVYVSNGGDQGEDTADCSTMRGGIFAIDKGNPIGGTPIAKGFRNPMHIRCAGDRCFVVELTREYSWMEGGRDKLVLFHPGEDWGYPCCATKDVPFPDVQPAPDCSKVPSESISFYISNAPFG